MPIVDCSNIDDVNWQQFSGNDVHLFNDVHIWKVNITNNIPLVESHNKILSVDECVRAKKYFHQKDRHRYIISRIALRSILESYTHLKPEAIEFEIGTNKKPHLINSPISNIHYNIAHSGNYILIAIANQDIGIDIEKIDAQFPITDIIPLCFNPKEIEFLNTQNSKTDAFYKLWTRKEALVKATTKGIDNDLMFVPCLNGKHTVAEHTIGSNNNWLIKSFIIDNDYIGSVAYTVTNSNLVFWEYGLLHQKVNPLFSPPIF